MEVEPPGQNFIFFSFMFCYPFVVSSLNFQKQDVLTMIFSCLKSFNLLRDWKDGSAVKANNALAEDPRLLGSQPSITLVLGDLMFSSGQGGQ